MSTNLIPLTTRVEPTLRAAVHDWRRQQPTIPPLSEAVRELIRRGLQAEQLRREKEREDPA
jgi:hypothetical protein